MTKSYDFSLHCFPVSRPTHSTEIVVTRGQVLGTLQKVCLVKTQIGREGNTQGEESVDGPAAQACPLSRHSLICTVVPYPRCECSTVAEGVSLVASPDIATGSPRLVQASFCTHQL